MKYDRFKKSPMQLLHSLQNFAFFYSLLHLSSVSKQQEFWHLLWLYKQKKSYMAFIDFLASKKSKGQNFLIWPK
jgi:hypothetical protein